MAPGWCLAPLGLASLGQCHQRAAPASARPAGLRRPADGRWRRAGASLRSVSLRSDNATSARARPPLALLACAVRLTVDGAGLVPRSARSTPNVRAPGPTVGLAGLAAL